MSRDPSLNSMIYFEAVARNGRISRAAEDLSVSPSAVSQQIKLLEEMLGVSLFRRERRQLSLTLEGEHLYTSVASALGMIRNARQSITRRRESHQLIIRAMPSFAVRWLGPRLADYIQQNPEWDLRVDASPDPSNFEREVIDFDIRYGTSSWEGLHCTPFLQDYVFPMCSPEYYEELRSQYESVEEMLSNARLIDSVNTFIQWDSWLARHQLSRSSMNAALRFDRSSMAIQQAVNNIGVILESTTLAARELLDGRLIPLTPEYPAVRFDAYWIVSPSRHQGQKLVKIFRSWMEQQVGVHDKLITNYLSSRTMDIEDGYQAFQSTLIKR
ncbi:LysR substrate-binding domain-containing protein [Oceanobacter kriegii]|uniref:LysR substrate-binding domain-containing protein n=1 Tax=Oceanobacter kriegii TaxID=64972 RepID=UPI000419C6B2|nr:LysR substrate-binding domain-containing protein [Oceanobacter kriegii]